MTTFADADMFERHLEDIYGQSEWPRRVTQKMVVQVHQDLVDGKKVFCIPTL